MANVSLNLTSAQQKIGRFTMTEDTTFNVAGLVPGHRYRLTLLGDHKPTFAPEARLAIGEYDNPSFVEIFAVSDTEYEKHITSFVQPIAYLGGTPANFSPGSSFTAVQNWQESGATALYDTLPNQSTGVITIPISGLYRVNWVLVGRQSNSNKELSILYWIRSALEGDFVVGVMDVATDKTSWRTGSSSFLFEATAGDTLQLGVSRTQQSIGTYQMDPCTFEVEYIGLA